MGQRVTRMTGSGAYVLAGVLRTDRARLRPLTPASPATVTLRQACRARKDLVRHRVAVANQLRAHLLCAFPAAVGLFSRLDSAISLAFLAASAARTASAGCRRNGWPPGLKAAGALDDLQPRIGDASRQLALVLWREKDVVAPGHHQRRHRDL